METKYDHSEKIATRRKALFPSEDTGSDLGHISPLHSDSNSEFNDEILENLDKEVLSGFSFLKHNIDDYIVLDRNESPNSQLHSLLSSPILYSPQTTVEPITPLRKSPTSSLKTPHDTSTVKLNVKQPKRKLQEDEGVAESNKSESPACKNYKIDASVGKSKVRTALFPENDISLPVNLFYSKNTQKVEHSHKIYKSDKQVAKLKISTSYLCNRRSKKKGYGQINAGVRHKIRKPRQKKVDKFQLMKAALNIMDKSPLNELFDEIACFKTKQISELRSLSPKNVIVENKENIENVKEIESASPNRKFFKSKPTNGVVTIIEHIKINVQNGKVNLIDDENKTTKKRKLPLMETEINTNEIKKTKSPSPYEFVNCDEETQLDTDINKILDMLNNDKTETQANTTPPNDQLAKALDLAQKENLILSPTSQMCDMASGLAINSPKRGKLNINTLLDKTMTSNSSVDMENQKKLFPIFYPGNKTFTEKPKDVNANATAKKWKSLPGDQMLLDAGQKRFRVTECHECRLVYHMGDPNEELMHLNYHNATNILKFTGWKNERIVADFMDFRIIKIVPGDSKPWWKKVKDLMEVVNRDLGFYENEFSIDNNEVYLYIQNKQIVGSLVVEPKNRAYKMLSMDNQIDLCSEETYPVKCGVSRIWVSKNYRQKGVATALLNILRTTYVVGYILNSNDIALSTPTADGKAFARKYFKTDNFFIYM